jgi:aspartyl-tRNA(Asn)/glutamyl-tRNA(Gln) amidotransferase subunit B
MTAYETVIGLEVHAQVLTESKMFCGCSAHYASAAPNTHVCPVCMALPGSLPVINRAAVEKTLLAGLALNCGISERAVFARKNYHYADLPKGYQISQYELPFCRDGWLEIETTAGKKRIGITRAHLEEDTGKLVHAVEGGRLMADRQPAARQLAAAETQTLVDLNRAGTPLLEIVTEPDIRSPEEAYAYLVELQRILRYLRVSTADMEKGAMRCEANVSVRPAGQQAFGTKVEVKNLNSFRSVRLALEYEVRRQVDALERGEKVVQVTMGWDEEAGRTVLQRSKESSDDYRYFPEPDLPPVDVSRAWVTALAAGLPELPAAKAARFVAEYALDEKDAALLAEDRAVSEFFEATLRALAAAGVGAGAPPSAAAKLAFNWITGELFRLMKASGVEIDAVKVTPAALAALLAMLQSGRLNQNGAKAALAAMFESGRDPAQVAQELGLTQVSDAGALASIVAKVIEANGDEVLKYRSGKESVFNWLLGQIMRETRGRGNPALVRELLEAALKE